MKIIHILKSNRYSGAENVVVSICRHLADAYQFAYAAPEGPVADVLREAGIRYYPLKQFKMRELESVIHEYKPDIIHAHDFSASVYSACLKRKCSLISHLHNDPLWIKKWNARSFAYWMQINRFDKILLVSDAILREAVFFKDGNKKIEIAGNPVDKSRIIQLAGTEVDKKYDVLFVGRLTVQKNPQKFIRIISMAKKKGLELKCAMLGEGELFFPCSKLIRGLGLEQNIEMLGFCRNPYPYMKNAKLLLVTSDWEGYGLAACEALVLGTPVLTSRTGGLAGIFAQMPEAFCKTEEEFCDKACALLCNKDKYGRFLDDVKKKHFFCGLPEYMEIVQKCYGRLDTRGE